MSSFVVMSIQSPRNMRRRSLVEYSSVERRMRQMHGPYMWHAVCASVEKADELTTECVLARKKQADTFPESFPLSL